MIYMPEENKLLGMYNRLKENKPDIPSYEAFRKMMNNGSKRKEVYNRLKENKPDIPSYEAFQNMIGPYLGITDNENDNDSAKLTNMQEEYSDRKKDRIQRRQEKYRKERQEDIDKRIAEINQNKDTYLKETEDTMPDRIYDEFNKANEEYGMMLDEWKKKRGIIQPAVMGAQNVTTVTAPHKTDKLLKLEKQLQAYKEIGYSAYYDYMNEKYPQEGILHEYDNEKQQDITEDAFEAFRRTDTGKAYIDDIGKRQKEIIAYGKDGFMNSEIGIEANKEIDKTKEENKKYEILHDALNKYYQDLFDKDEYLSNINKSMIESFDVMFGDMITEARMPSIRQSVRGIIDEKRNEYEKIYDDNGSIFKGLILDYFAAQVPGGRESLKATGHKDTNIQAATENLIKDSERKIQAATERRGFGKGVADIALQWETWSAGTADLMNNITLKNVIDKYEESENPEEELTPEEQLLVESYYTNSLVTSYFGDMIKKGYNIGNVTGESLPFMLEMFTTAAVSGTLTKGLTRWVGKKFGADVVKEAIERQGKRGVLRNIAGAYDEIGGLQFLKTGTGKIAEASVKGLGHSLTTGAPRSAAIAFEEMTGDSDIEIDYDREKGEWKFEYKGQKDQTEKVLALYRGIMETSIEFGTEYMGEAFSDLIRAGAKAFALDKTKLYKELSKAYRNTKIGKAAQAVYFDGMLEENMEEWAGSLLRSILEPEKYNITEEFSGENIADTFMGLLPMSIAFGVFGGVNAGRNYINNRKKAASAEEMIRQYNPEYLDTWKSLMDMSNDDGRNYVTDRIATISDEIKSIDKDDTLSQKEKNSLKQKKATELMALQVKWEQILMDEAASVKEDEDTRRFLQNIVPYINRKTGNLEMVNIDIDGEIKTMAVINNDNEQYMLMGEDGKVVYKEKTVVDAIPENEWNIIKGSDIINEIEERRKYINLNPYDRYGIDIKPVKGSVMTDVEGKAIKMPDSESEIIVDDVYDDGYVDISWIDNNGNMEMRTLSEREYKDYAIKHVEDNMKYQTYLINTITSGENVGSLLLNPETGEMSENAIRDANYYLKKEKEILVENKVDVSELEYIIENNDFENIAKIMQTLDEETREHLLKYVYYKKIDNAIMLNARQYVTLLDKQNREATERKIWNENGNGKINQFEHNGKLYYVKGANNSSMYYVVDSNGNNVENGTDSDIVNSFISADKVDGKIIEISPEDVNYNSNGEQYLSGVAKVIENYHELSQGEEYTIYDKNNRPTDIIIQGSDENGNIIYTKRDSKKLLTMPENDMRKSIDDYEHEQMLNENRKESDRRKGLEELKNGDTFILVYNGQLYKNARYKNKNSSDKLNYISLSGELGKRDTVKLTDEELSNARNAALDMISEQEKQQEMATSIIENEEQKQAVKIAITEFGKTLHAEENGVVFIDSIDELPENYAGNLARNTEGVEGYYDPETGKIYIVLDVIIGNKTADEALQRGKQVIFHELVAHKTLRDILNGFGDRYYDSFLQGVFNGMNEKDIQFYARYVWDYVLGNKTKGNSWETLSNDERYDVVNKHRAIIADEYIARLSETVLLDKGSENDKSTWRQILDWFKRFIEQSFGIRIEFSDEDITRMLFASKAKLEQNENIDIDNDTETNISILENKFKESRKILSYLNAKIKQTDKKIKELNKQNDEIDNSLEADSKEWDIAKTDIYVKIDQLQKEKQWLSDLSRKYSEYLSELENVEQEKQIDESEQENNEEQEFNPKKQTLSERAYILSNKEDYLGIDDRIKISIVLNKTKFRWNNEKGRGLGDLVRFSNSERKSRLGILNNKNGYSIENFVEYLQSQEGDSLLDVVSRQDYFELMKITEEILLDYNTYSDMIESVEDKISEIESRYEEMARQNPYYEDYNITEFKKDDYFNFTDDDIEVPFSVNEKNDVFEQKDKNYQNEYRTKDGRNIRYNSQAQLSIDFEESDVTGRVVDNNIQQQNVSEVIRLYDSGLKDDIICHVERVFTETGDFDFTGTQKIENATDVAYIFKQLENYAIENSFAVIVKNGNPIVLHLGMGKTGTTIIDTVPIIESTKRLNPEKVYFIHNHPSGNIMASKEDVQILNSLRKSLGDIVQDGIIINTLSGMYGTFSESSTESHINETDKDTYPIKVYRFSKQVFNKSYNPNVKLNNQYEVAKYISSQRLGNRAKLNYLVLNNSGHVVANVFTPLSYKSSYNDIAKHVVNNSLVAGGASGVIIYGNNTNILNMFSISKLIREYSIGNLSLLDIVDVQGNYNNVFDNNETYKNSDVRLSVDNSGQEMRHEDKVVYDAVVQMLRDAGIPVEVLTNEQMEQLAERGDAVLQSRMNSLDIAANTIRNWIKGNVRGKSFTLSFPQHVREKISKMMGIDFDSHNITANSIAHILKSHGEQGDKLTSNSIPLRNEDLELIPYIMVAPDEIVKGNTDITGREGIRFYKYLSNGYIIVVEMEYKNSQNDMETITMWAEKSSTATNAQSKTTTDMNVRNAISSTDVAKIRKDAENAMSDDIKSRLMTVYHGSGAKFDAFDHSFMGTGEGAQAYGWGSYVTEVEGIGKTYAYATSTQIFKGRFGEFYLRRLRQAISEGRSFEEEKKTLLDMHSDMYKKAIKDRGAYSEFISDYEKLSQIEENDLPQRNLYTVEIPDNTGNNYLDWEKSMSEEQIKMVDSLSEKEGYGRIMFDDFQQLKKHRDDLKMSDTAMSKGAFLYVQLTRMLGSDKAASEFLSRAGFVGISYPAQSTTGGRSDNAKNYVIFNEKDLEIKDRISFMRGNRSRWEDSAYTEIEDGTKISRNDDIIYGATVGGKIYLNGNALNPEVPIHEYTHIWDAACQKLNPELWNRGVELMKQTPMWEEVKNDPNYADLQTDDEIASEVHSRLTGIDGSRILQEMVERNKKNGVTNVANAVTLREQLKRWLSDFWYWLKDTMMSWTKEEAGKVNLQDFINMPLKDLVNNNTDIRFSIKENKNEKPAMFSMTSLPDSLEEAERRAWEDMLGSNTIFRTANKVYSNWFDSTNAVKKLQEAISQTRGIEITPDLNVRDMLICEQSVIRAGIDKKEIEFIKPLQKAVENLVKKGATYEHITDYLIAKHGLERNEYFQRKLQEEYDKEYEKELNKKPNAKREIAELKDNAGLTGLARKYGFDENKFTEVAENIVSEFENKYDVNEIWDKIKAMTNDMLDTRLDAGLLSKESYDYIKNMYDYYIPLRGWGEEMTSSIYDYRNKTTLESSYTPVDKKAKGRTSLAYDPVSELILMMGNSVEFSAKNKTRQALLKLADISDTELLTIKRAFSLNSVNEDTRNMVESKGIEEKDGGLLKIDGKIVDPNNKNEHYITVYVNGNPYVIEVEGSPEVWQAFNPPARDFTQSKIGGLTRFYSMINTTFDVSFALGNIARDFRSAIFLSFVNGGLGYTKDIIKYMAVGGSNMVSLMNGRCKDKKLQQYWDEFVQGGGETGFTRQINAEDIHKDMLKLAGYAKRNSVGKVADTVGEAIEKAMDGWNRYFEDMPRFAAFLANRENGKSIEESVMAAKEITVNFNIKGASPASGLARGLYSFFNASLQGFNTYLKAAKKNPLRFGIALSTITFTGFLVPLLNMWLLSVFGDDDDWREYENLTTYTGNNNTVIFLGKDNGFLKIPHPQETRLFSSLGNMFFRNYMGWNHGESMESQVFGMIMDFMPMNIYEGGDSKNYNLIGGVVTALTPSFFKPLSEAGFNRDYLGRKIYKEQQYSNQPRWTLAYDDVNPISLWFTRMLSGNDNARNRYININPDLIDHVVTGYTGGAGRYLGSLIKFANYLANEDSEWKNEKPFIRRFHQADTPKQVEYAINRGYRDIKNIFQDSKHSWDIYKKDPINKNAVKFIDTEEYAIYDALTWEAQKVYVDKKGRTKPSKKRDGSPAIKESNYISDIDKLEKEYKKMLEITDSDKKPTEKELEEMYNLIQRQKKSVIDLVYWTTIEYRKRKHDFSQWQKKTSEHRYTESEAIRNLEETMNRK